ncbi:MAG TPA: hypothetical protein VN045_10095 [Microbacteriaceae bacterium]|jgi:hypothetical protein|nr:hypothetical protein [Microbacteriaceae bacterium]
MARDDEYFRSVIRLFPDYAESVIWFAIGPVPYEQSRISARLRKDLEAWESFYYRSLTEDDRWGSAEDRALFADDARRLAERLAAEVGGQFEVEYRDSRDKKIRARSDSGPTNTDAAAAFTQISRDLDEMQARIDREVEAGASFGWFAYVPTDEEDEDPLL